MEDLTLTTLEPLKDRFSAQPDNVTGSGEQLDILRKAGIKGVPILRINKVSRGKQKGFQLGTKRHHALLRAIIPTNLPAYQPTS